MEKINIIIPITTSDYDLSQKTKELKAFLKKYEEEFKVFFVANSSFVKSPNYKNSQNFKLIETTFKSINHLIIKGLESIEDGSLIILNLEDEDWQSIFTKILEQKRPNNIILHKVNYKKSAFKNYFYNLTVKIYQHYLKFLSLEKDFMCENTFQYFNEDATKVLRSLPAKSSYLRNFETLTGYQVKIIEKIVTTKPKTPLFLNTKNSNILMSLISLGVSLFFAFLTLIFTNAILAINNGIGFYFLILALSAGAMFLSGYLIVKEVIRLRGDL